MKMDTSRENPILAIVLPCYNEEAVLYDSNAKVVDYLRGIIAAGIVSPASYILYVDDGSTDRTWEILTGLNAEYPETARLKLSRNRGQQNAMLAGLEASVDIADITVTVDVDLQDDLAAITAMVGKYKEGAEVVYGVRDKRDTDTWMKRSTALAFYKVMERLGVNTVYNHSEFRMMSRRAVKALEHYREKNLFLRGIVPLIGYKQDKVYYDRKERLYGETNYSMSKMINLAVDGITSFSVKPVRMIFLIGVVFMLVALAILVFVLVNYFSHNSASGWASTMVSIWFCSGVLLMSMSIVGEYIGKIYVEVKDRPRYFTEEFHRPLSHQEAQKIGTGQD